MIDVPDAGVLNKEELAAYRACKDYDDRLVFMRNPANGQYAIFIKTDRSNNLRPLHPVLGFGWDVPHADVIKERLYNADGWKHGRKMLDDMDDRKRAHDAHNEMIRDAAASEVVEQIEHVLRKAGDSPVVKSTRNISRK